DMFPPIQVGGEQFVLRPANCPHHALIYASEQRSFRDLPIRLSELGAMFRSELSGVLGGLSRVRQINLDDVHCFARPDQVQGEIAAALESIQRCYAVLGIGVTRYRLSLRGPGDGYLGSPAQWQDAEVQLQAALDQLELKYEAAEGEAAFYGPKIDVQVTDPAGREETLSTVQLDFNQPERFDLGYTGSDGQRHRPVMIHRGGLSSMDRMVAFLIERYDGAFPPWLAPVQAVVLPVTDGQDSLAASLVGQLRAAGLRAEADPADATLGARVRKARQGRVPYVVVLGAKEAASGQFAVRLRDGRQITGVSAADLVAGISAQVTARSAALGFGS
ncbi:MAG: threonine--tRNA ligase, partial [Actinomycetota bacterium]